MWRKLSVSDMRVCGRLPAMNPDWLPEKDRPILPAADRLRCAALVTGDRRHFGVRFSKILGVVTLYSPRSLAEMLGLV